MSSSKRGFKPQTLYYGLLIRLVPGLLLLLISVTNLRAQEKSPAQPTREQINQAVLQLGAGSFQEREDASLFLWKAGRAAKQALETAADSNDGEIAFRAKSILEKFRFGIFPDTPPDVIAMIKTFRTGDFTQKQNVMSQLSQKKLFATMLALLRMESDENQKRALAQNFIQQSSDLVATLLAEGDMETIEELLHWSASFDTYGVRIRDYAALLMFTGKLQSQIERLQQTLDTESDEASVKQDRLMLAHFYAIKGDYEKAKSLAITNKKHDAGYYLLSDLSYRTQNWKTLVQMAPGDQGVENLGFTAAFSRLAGDQAAFEKAIAGLKRLAIDEPDRTFMCGEALMINHRWQDAIDLHANRKNVAMAFRILCEQSRFNDAFALVGLDDPRNKATRWFESLAVADNGPSEKAASDIPTDRQFEVALQVAKALHALGEHEQAAALLEALAKVTDDVVGHKIRGLIAMEMELGMFDLAFEQADQALQNDKLKNAIFYGLFQSQSAIAKCLDENFQSRSENVSAKKLYALIRPQPNELLNEDELRDIVEQTKTRVKTIFNDDPFGVDEKLASAMAMMGNLALIHRQSGIARECFQQQQSFDPTSITMTKYADQLANEKNWAEAAAHYERAWRIDQSNPLTLYLTGHALIQTGKAEAGQPKIDLAKKMPLANTEKRRDLAAGLSERGFPEAANEQWELIFRFGRLQSWEGSQAWAVRDAAMHIARQHLDSNPLRAARLMERQVFYLLKTNSAFSKVEYYPRHMHLIHKTRAKGLLAAGRIDEALAEMELSMNARIDQVDSTIEFVHGLEDQDHPDDAQRVYEQTAGRFNEITRAFPNSSHHHNNLAWLMARCDRDLDEALAHANEANRLDPDTASYIDTLAEVHFRKGDPDKAIALIQKAIQIDPVSQHLEQQLKRFQQGSNQN